MKNCTSILLETKSIPNFTSTIESDHNTCSKHNKTNHFNTCYSPYSKINVVSYLLSTGNVKTKGVNVENASYGLTICAEKSAIVSAISNGISPKDFKSIEIFTDSFESILPCGSCLQFIAEFVNENFPIITEGNKYRKEYVLKDLLPHNFLIKNVSFLSSITSHDKEVQLHDTEM